MVVLAELFSVSDTEARVDITKANPSIAISMQQVNSDLRQPF